MKIRNLSLDDVQLHPEKVWSAYVDLLANEDPLDLSAEQRPAQLVFWYERAVQSGGHEGYFQTYGSDRLEATIEALGALGAIEQQRVLKEAGASHLKKSISFPQTGEEFSEWVRLGDLTPFDTRLSQCSTGLVKHLERYLERHQAAFVVVHERMPHSLLWRNPWMVYTVVQVAGVILCYAGLVVNSRLTVLLGCALLLPGVLTILGGVLLFPGILAIPGLGVSVTGDEVATGIQLALYFTYAIASFAIFSLYRGIKYVIARLRASPPARKIGRITFLSEPKRIEPKRIRTPIRERARKARLPALLLAACLPVGWVSEWLSRQSQSPAGKDTFAFIALFLVPIAFWVFFLWAAWAFEAFDDL